MSLLFDEVSGSYFLFIHENWEAVEDNVGALVSLVY